MMRATIGLSLIAIGSLILVPSSWALEIKVKTPNEPMFMGKGLTGAVADLRIYNRALSADEIAKLAQ